MKAETLKVALETVETVVRLFADIASLFNPEEVGQFF